MVDLSALHDAVTAAPDDVRARVAYADAVATTDPARSEFIKLQLALAGWRRDRIEPAGSTDAYLREQALRDQHGDRWADGIRDLVTRFLFRRGFVEEVAIDARRFLATAPELYRHAPILHLTLSGVQPVAAELFASPHLARIRSLDLATNQLGDAEAEALARSPHLANLQWLDLSRNAIGKMGLEALVASKQLPALGYLGFAGNAFPDPTPQHADEYETDSPVATELQKTYGPRSWLSTSPPRSPWPPERDAV